ncbi:MAG: HEAT repeat domain-containing protein [Deltaproteobacteria bacterium]|nr:HEAT repeat domain-containing protein [Deltaproteobacteria bacterium]
MPRRSSILTHALALVAYLAAAAAATWPIAIRPSLAVWGEGWDVLNNLWFFGEMRHILTHGDWSWTTDHIFFPVGYDLRSDLAHFLLPLASVPLQFLFGLATTYNVLVLICLTFSAWSAFVLARHLTGRTAPSFAVGLLWMAHPTAVRDLAQGSLEVVGNGFFVLAFLALLRLVKDPTRRRTAVFAVAWLLCGFANWVMAGMLGIAFLAVVATHARKGGAWNRPLITRAAASLVVVAVVAAPIVLPLVRGESFAIEDEGVDLSSILPTGDVADLPTESGTMRALTEDSWDVGELFATQDEADTLAPLLWWTWIVLTLVGLTDRERRAKWMPLLAVGFFVLAAGPFWRWMGHFQFVAGRYYIPTPAWPFYAWLPGMDLFYRPYRFTYPALLMLIGPATLGAGIVLDRLSGLRRAKVYRPAAALLLAGVVALAYQAGGRVSWMAAAQGAIFSPPKDGDRAWVVVPFFPLPISVVNAWPQVAQANMRANRTLSQTPALLNSTLIRTKALKKFAALMDAQPALKTLLDLQLKKTSTPTLSAADLTKLRDQGFSRVIVRTRFRDIPEEAAQYARVGPELFLLLNDAVGAPEATNSVLAYDLNDGTLRDAYVEGARVAPVHFSSLPTTRHGAPTQRNYPAVDVGPDGVSAPMPISLPQNAADADAVCAWIRVNGVTKGDGRVAFRFGERTTQFEVEFGGLTDHWWRWQCATLTADVVPEDVTRLRVASDLPMTVEFDQLSLVHGGATFVAGSASDESSIDTDAAAPDVAALTECLFAMRLWAAQYDADVIDLLKRPASERPPVVRARCASETDPPPPLDPLWASTPLETLIFSPDPDDQARALLRLDEKSYERNRERVRSLASAERTPAGDVRMLAVEAIGAYGDGSDAATVGKALADSVAVVRYKAAWAAGRLKAVSLIDGLETALQDPDADVAREAAWALGEMSDEADVAKPLLTGLSSENRFVVDKSAVALGDEVKRDGAEALQKAFDAMPEGERTAVCRGVARVDSPMLTEALECNSTTNPDQPAPPDKVDVIRSTDVEQLAHWTLHGDSETAKVAVTSLGLLGDGRLKDAAATRFATADPDTRAMILLAYAANETAPTDRMQRAVDSAGETELIERALNAMGTAPAAEKHIDDASLRAPDVAIRLAAAQAVGMLEAPVDKETLFNLATRDDSKALRFWAAWALGRTSSKDDCRKLASLPDEPPNARDLAMTLAGCPGAMVDADDVRREIFEQEALADAVRRRKMFHMGVRDAKKLVE